MSAWIDILVGTLLLIGALFAVVAAVGLVRLPDLYTRMHAASKAGTLGSGVLLVALAIADGTAATASRALMGVVFFLLTAPISAHLLARAAYGVGYKLWDGSVMDELAGHEAHGGANQGPDGMSGADGTSGADEDGILPATGRSARPYTVAGEPSDVQANAPDDDAPFLPLKR